MKNSLSIPGRYFLLFSIFAGMILASCNGQEKPGSDTPLAAGTEPGFSMNCVIMTRAQVQSWVDSGWTKPTDPNRIRAILFQFYSPDAINAANNMELLAYPGSNYSDVRVNGRINLEVDKNCVALKTTGKTIFANNVVTMNTLGILDKEGKLKDFDFVRFRPVKERGEYITFAIEVIKVVNEKETQLSDGDTNPCPPYCPPNPEDTLRRAP